MAELLVKAEDSSTLAEHPEGAWRRGDVVVVMPDGHPWGREECPPKFNVVKMPGVSVEECQHLLEHEEKIPNVEGMAMSDLPSPERKMLQRRKTQFNLDKLGMSASSDSEIVEERPLLFFEKDITIQK